MTDILLASITNLIMAAAEEVCDEDLLSLLKTGKGRLRPSQKVGGPFDYTTSFPRAAYKRMLATSQQQGKDKERRLTQDTNIVESKLMSTFGTSLTKSFDSAEHLAQAIIASLPEEETQYILADVRVLGGGIISTDSGPVNLTSNAFERNTAGSQGGAAFFQDVTGSLPLFTNVSNTFVDNVAFQDPNLAVTGFST